MGYHKTKYTWYLVYRHGYLLPFFSVVLFLFSLFVFVFLFLFLLFSFLCTGSIYFLPFCFVYVSWAFEEAFGYDHGWVIGETGYICDWTGVEEYSNELPSCVMGICGGHKEQDILPFTVKVKISCRGGEAGWVGRVIYR